MTLNIKHMKRIGSTLICLVLVLTILTSIAAPPPAKAAAVIPVAIITKEMVAIALVILGMCGFTFAFASSSEAQSKVVELITNFTDEKPNIEPPDMFPDEMLASFATTGAIIGVVADIWNQFIDWLRGGGLETVLPETVVESLGNGAYTIDGAPVYPIDLSLSWNQKLSEIESKYGSVQYKYINPTQENTENNKCYFFESSSEFYVYWGKSGSLLMTRLKVLGSDESGSGGSIGAFNRFLIFYDSITETFQINFPNATKFNFTPTTRPEGYLWLKNALVGVPLIAIPPEIKPVPETDDENAPVIDPIPGIPFDPATYPDAVIEGVGTGAVPVPPFETNPNPNPDPEPEPEPDLDAWNVLDYLRSFFDFFRNFFDNLLAMLKALLTSLFVPREGILQERMEQLPISDLFRDITDLFADAMNATR